jgi:hypothetical protein
MRKYGIKFGPEGETMHVAWKDADTEMFNYGDMSFWGFAASDVIPPAGEVLDFNEAGEPVFVPNDEGDA